MNNKRIAIFLHAMSPLSLSRPTNEETMGAKRLPLAYTIRYGVPPIFGRHDDVHKRFGFIDQISKRHVLNQSVVLVSKLWRGDGTLQGCSLYPCTPVQTELQNATHSKDFSNPCRWPRIDFLTFIDSFTRTADL